MMPFCQLSNLVGPTWPSGRSARLKKPTSGLFQNVRQGRRKADPACQGLRQGAQQHLPPDNLQRGIPVPGALFQDQGDPDTVRVLPGLQPDPDRLPQRVHQDGHVSLLPGSRVHV